MNTPLESKNPYFVPVSDRSCENMYYRMHRLHNKGWKKTARFYKFLMWRLFYCFIPPEAKIGKHLVLPHHGFGVVMNQETSIGDDAIILHNTTFGNGLIEIGECFTIGAGASVIGPVKIGDHVTVGANAFVNQDIPSGSLVIGNPGKIIKNRGKEEIEQIRRKREGFFHE